MQKIKKKNYIGVMFENETDINPIGIVSRYIIAFFVSLKAKIVLRLKNCIFCIIQINYHVKRYNDRRLYIMIQDNIIHFHNHQI